MQLLIVQAFHYALVSMSKASEYLDYGTLELDHKEAASQKLSAYTLIGRGKLSNVDTQVWLTWLLERIDVLIS